MVLEHVLGHVTGSDEPLHGLDGNVPDLLVLLLEEEDHARGLSVEGGGDMQDGVANDGLDGLVLDGGLGLEAVVSATGLDQLKERSGGRVLELRSGGTHFS